MLQRFDSGEARGCSCQHGDAAVAACGAGRGACQWGYWGLKEPSLTDGGGQGLAELRVVGTVLKELPRRLVFLISISHEQGLLLLGIPGTGQREAACSSGCFLLAFWESCLSFHLPCFPAVKEESLYQALQEQVPVPVYHPTPSQTRLATQLTEEEQIRIAQRIGLIQHLPKGVYDPGRDGSEKKIRECVICMMDFVYGDPIRFLPCMHIYHLDCIDDWLMRSFTCPSCMEPVDAALLSSYETN
ncbi:PREDICTED: RING finger protein 11 [Haliaeetus leucocephalus]|uniref:RING finger protein 11 n=1 Tax=Haliaeetus leucocephalus TaxID=52644 RepID=UPI00053CBD02|nr:PREDICTED: RING finger protein 11 [Haliaeetus leucocephalus]